MKEETLIVLKSIATTFALSVLSASILLVIFGQTKYSFWAFVVFVISVCIEVKIDEYLMESFWNKHHKP